jgi:hypothetical protein
LIIQVLFKKNLNLSTYKNGSLWSKADRCVVSIPSELSHINLDTVALRISANWASVKRINGSPFSYLPKFKEYSKPCTE